MNRFKWYSGSSPSAAIRHIKLIGGNKIISWRSTTLRKEHRCANCSRRVAKGERAYLRTNWGHYEQRLCVECVNRIEQQAG